MSRPVHLDAATEITASAETVYAVVADIRRRPHWLAELADIDAPDEPLRPGARFDGESALLWHRFLGRSEITEVEEGRALAEQVVIGARFRSVWRLEPVGDGTTTRVRHVIEIDYPDGPLGWLERWVLRRRLAVMQRRSLKALAEEVTGHS